MSTIDRRKFLQTAAGIAVGAGLGSFYTPRSGAVELNAGKPNKGMPTRRLGKTGYEASIFSLGGMFLIMEGNTAMKSIASSTAPSTLASIISTRPPRTETAIVS